MISINFGVRTAFPSNVNLATLASGAACALGQVDNHQQGNTGYFVDYTIVGGPTGVSPTGTITFYLITAPNNGGSPGTYTDGISPTGASVGNLINNARVIATVNLNGNAQTINDCFRLPLVDPPPFWSLLVQNNSGAPLGTGSSIYFEPYTYND